jgi:pyridoxine 5-phosphate synthase
LEMANVPEMVQLAVELKPDIVCVVPERRQEVTTEGGLDAVGQRDTLTVTCRQLTEAGIEVSLFIAPDLDQVEASAQVGAGFVELHTGSFAEHYHSKRERQVEIERLISAAERAHRLGLKVNAGHGLNCENLALLHLVPHLVELNIGHSIVSRAVFVGLPIAIREMLRAMEGYGF